jgi:choline dehydrogenase
MHVQPSAGSHPFFGALLEAAESAGLQRFENSSGRLMEAEEGCALVDEIVHDGRRQSVFRSYTYSRMDQPNLTVLTGAMVTRILFDRKRSSGMEFSCEGKLVRVGASLEVILSLGVIQTPKLLMHSGIGDEAELGKFHISVLQSLPGTVSNLHDHIALGCIWEASENSLASAPRRQAVCFWKTDPALDAPNLFTYARPGAAITRENQAQFTPPASSWCLSTGMRPASRGAIHLTGPNAADPLQSEQTCGTTLGRFHTSAQHLAWLSSPRCCDSSERSGSTTKRTVQPLRQGNDAHDICSPLQTLTHLS